MKIKEQTRKLATGCSKHRFEVVDRTDEVSSKYVLRLPDKIDEVSNIYLRLRLWIDEVSNHTYGKVTLTRFEEIFEEY
ncbi:hypothetical protein [Streptococcus pneumoniae]|uniref:hypothetical protein n=1 Tax=Streptococcus pneumoniae TaxID=1313 RepID=UPI000B596E92|nr:hypothetical protein [Streptococcus pneumoniae]